jgi:putative heme-binding domain-containing protein
MSRFFFVFLLLPFTLQQLAGAEPGTLQERLSKESVAELAKAARESGDAGRGAVLFFQPFLTCAKCHDDSAGTRLGPDISKGGKESTAEYLIESVLFPSKIVKKGYETVVINKADGKSVTGLVVAEKEGKLELLDPSAGGKSVFISLDDIEKRSVAKNSLMPEGMVNLLSDRQQFLDLAKYLIEIVEGGPNRAKELRPAVTALVIPEYEKEIDHAGLIKSWNEQSLKRGEAIYSRICANCHGTKDQPGSLPTSPRFAAHTFKNGSDPLSLYQTLTRGYGMMAPQTWMVPRQKYDLIHYLRETYLKPHNPTQYTSIEPKYMANLPKGNSFGPPALNVEPWVTMDYGPSLANTYEVGGSGPNIAYKGIAVRLDPGAGGVSRGKRWALFDQDTMRFAAAWSGDGFIDWKGIHFNGMHQIHPKLVGDIQFSNPVGPGWAEPKTGSFKDPRFLGRDQRPYGPLPKEWAKYRGSYAFGDRTILSYTVGDASVLESEGSELNEKQPNGVIFTRTLDIGKSSHDMLHRVAQDGVAVAVSDS